MSRLGTVLALAVFTAAAAGCDGASVAGPDDAPRFAEDQCYNDGECNLNPPPAPAARYSYGIDPGLGPTVSPGGNKAHFLSVYSRAHENVAESWVTAEVNHYYNCNNANKYPYQKQTSAAYGSPASVSIPVYFYYPYNQKYRLEVLGTHRFVPMAGVTGGGTFSKSYSVCY
ncbi:MAG TPA: hypothetical protein VHG51_19340 [Longimicrobiaceae bacterium]|nr:hypothetical protein [Longimicrobiaceae bacterium]